MLTRSILILTGMTKLFSHTTHIIQAHTHKMQYKDIQGYDYTRSYVLHVMLINPSHTCIAMEYMPHLILPT